MAAGDVLAALRDGRAFAQIAEGHGKSAQGLGQAALTVRQEILVGTVTVRRLTKDEADQMMVSMKAHRGQRLSSAWQPRGRGFGDSAPAV